MGKSPGPRMTEVLAALPSNDCVEWPGTKHPWGYGITNGEMAHRAVYRRVVGEIPAGLEIDHLCRNRPCVNPAHLEVVTHKENTLRGDTIAARNAAKTHCPHGHEYTDENTYINSRGSRECRSCRGRTA